MLMLKHMLVKLYEKFAMILLANLKLDGNLGVLCDKKRENVFLVIFSDNEEMIPVAKLLSEDECDKYGPTIDMEQSVKLNELFSKYAKIDTRKKIKDFDNDVAVDGMSVIYKEMFE